MVQLTCIMIMEQCLHLDFNMENQIIYLFLLLFIGSLLYFGKQWLEKEVEERTQKPRVHFQQNRLIAMGELMGNISHHWKQPLSGISVMLLNIQKHSHKNNLSQEYLEEKIMDIEDTIEEMAKTIEEFSEYLTPAKEVESFSLNKSINIAVKLLHSVFSKHNIQIIFEESETIYYNGWKNELIQVITIILNNAKDALIKNEILDKKKILITLSKNNGKVKISIKDNGLGISDKNLCKVFDPYFSTAHKTQGRGLGLYLAKMITIERFNGTINVYNNDGAVFELILGEI